MSRLLRRLPSFSPASCANPPTHAQTVKYISIQVYKYTLPVFLNVQDAETTIRVHKRDALLLKQLQGLLEMHDNMLTQAEMMHKMLAFMLLEQKPFFEVMERDAARHEELMKAMMKLMQKRLRETEEF